MMNNVDVRLEPGLENYALSEPGSEEELREAVRWSWDFVALGPERITGPLLGAAYAAPLSEVMVPDFTLWVWGGTGSYKSTLAAVLLSHFGDFTETNLPLSFASTSNALERSMFLAKDVLVVVDDWRPGVTRADSDDMDRKAQNLLRAVGNRQGRGRMTSDIRLRESYPPRGVVAVTAEALPEGPNFESADSRAISINVSREDIDVGKLTELQRHKGMLTYSMTGYIRWLAACYDQLASDLPRKRDTFRDNQVRTRLTEGHPRTPRNTATLIVALRQFEDFTVDIGAMDKAAAREAYERARNGVLDAAEAHTNATRGGDPATRFIEILRSLFESGEIYVEPKAHPLDDWVVEEAQDRSFFGPGEAKHGNFVGWADETYLYLEKEAAFAAVSGFASRGGIPFGIKQKALWNALARSGMSLTEGNRSDTTASIKGKTKRVVQIPCSVVSP